MILPLEWAFGAGRQAVTFVTRVNSQWFLEHSTSYYSATKQTGLTPGQAMLRPASIKDAAGVLYPIDDPATAYIDRDVTIGAAVIPRPTSRKVPGSCS